MRAESFFNFATYIEQVSDRREDWGRYCIGRSTNGESFTVQGELQGRIGRV
jgi:predicted ATPase